MPDVTSGITLSSVFGWVVDTALVVVGYFLYSFNSKLDKLEENTESDLKDHKKEVDDKFYKLESDFEKDILRIHDRLDESEKTILSAIAATGDRTVQQTHCDAKQELWAVKTDADRTANTKEHTVLVGTISELKDVIKLVGESQVMSSRQVADELREVQECVKNLTKGLDCD